MGDNGKVPSFLLSWNTSYSSTCTKEVCGLIWWISLLTWSLVFPSCQNQLAVLCPNSLPWTKVGVLKLKWITVSHCCALPRDSLFQHSGERELCSDWCNCVFIEPVGSSIPKFPTMDNVRGFQVMRGQSFTLLCPAQGFPVPTYR